MFFLVLWTCSLSGVLLAKKTPGSARSELCFPCCRKVGERVFLHPESVAAIATHHDAVDAELSGNMMRTLYDLSDLKESKFGRPPPRHGLILLWWFVHECVQIDSNGCMTALCNPANGAFGFHRFYNRERLLPYTNLPYYEVGNLHITHSLPRYVTVNYTSHSDNSNKDRIIVSFYSRWNRFESIYVTQHSDHSNFDQNHTYCLSIELMKNIKDLSRQEFLKDNPEKILSNPPVNPSEHVSIDILNGGHVQERPSHTLQSVQRETCLSKKCCCVLICVLILLLVIIAAIVFLLFKMK